MDMRHLPNTFRAPKIELLVVPERRRLGLHKAMGHHFVPQRYLRNFEDRNKPGYIWVHDKREDLAHLAEIEHVAQSKGFYSNDTEDMLARDVELPGSAAIEKLTRNQFLSGAERAHVAIYIAVMFKRVPAARRHATELIPGTLTNLANEFRQAIRSLGAQGAAPELIARRLDELDAAERKLAEKTPQNVLDVIREPWPSEELVRLLLRMTWRVLISSGPQYFITTDNPAFIFKAYGLGKDKSELCFPLSTTHLLHSSWQNSGLPLVFTSVRTAIVKEMNRRLASGAERLAFFHEPAPWLSAMVTKESPYLSVIQWK
jgi:hypothetical protein